VVELVAVYFKGKSTFRHLATTRQEKQKKKEAKKDKTLKKEGNHFF